MPNFLNNRLLLGIVLSLVVYWLSGEFMPATTFSAAVSVFLMVAGVAALARFSSAAWSIVIHQRRSDEDDGGHWAAIGVTALAAGAVYAGGFNLVWLVNGQPMSWIGTPGSNLGRGLMAAGFLCLFLSPDTARNRISLPSVLWLVVIGTTMTATAFMLGTQFSPDPRAGTLWVEPVIPSLAGPTYPQCPPARDVWGVASSKLYHTTDSPYRPLITPDRCFTNAGEAERAGYRAASF